VKRTGDKLVELYKFGKKSLSFEGKFGFPSISQTNFYTSTKLLAPKLIKSIAMSTFWLLASSIKAQRLKGRVFQK
jgi:hypothetical protein